jgi:hypothetical protein
MDYLVNQISLLHYKFTVLWTFLDEWRIKGGSEIHTRQRRPGMAWIPAISQIQISEIFISPIPCLPVLSPELNYSAGSLSSQQV